VELAREIRRTLEVAQDGSSRIAFVVRLLSTFSRGEVGEEKPTDPLAALDAALRLATHHVHSRAHLLTDFHPLPHVRANEARLAQVFLNLLVNAAQAIDGPRENNKIIVRAHGTRERAVIEVEDTGSGISPEHAARIFEPFFSTKPAGAGTGLGLSISKDIVEAVGGTITVQSTPKKGTVFRVELPAHVTQSSSPPAPIASQAGKSAESTKARVLVIDDESSVGWLVRACLPTHEVETTTDPIEGLLLLEERRFDVVLCDYDMPDMNGLELYRQLCETHPELKDSFALMAGTLDAATEARLTESGLPVMQKPFSLAQLEAYVASRAQVAPRHAS
jgi:two-component system NtrC family sensor kinase